MHKSAPAESEPDPPMVAVSFLKGLLISSAETVTRLLPVACMIASDEPTDTVAAEVTLPFCAQYLMLPPAAPIPISTVSGLLSRGNPPIFSRFEK